MKNNCPYKLACYHDCSENDVMECEYFNKFVDTKMDLILEDRTDKGLVHIFIEEKE